MDNYAVIGSEAVNHYVQIFDMRKLLKIKKNQKPKTFSTSKDLTSLFTGLPIGRTHNIVVNNDLKYAVAVSTFSRDIYFWTNSDKSSKRSVPHLVTAPANLV